MSWTREQDIDEIVNTLKAILNELQGLREDFKAQTEVVISGSDELLSDDFWEILTDRKPKYE